ncbi:hypothetical protein ACJX0J_029368, partial [Zea mays]
KYLFWDPDHSFLSLGKYTALKEIDWVKKTQEHRPSLQYYYLGYCIHSCNKMRYKAAYQPSELLLQNLQTIVSPHSTMSGRACYVCVLALKSNFLNGFTLKRKSGDSVRLDGLKLKEKCREWASVETA